MMKVYQHPTKTGALGATLDVQVRTSDDDRPIAKFLGSNIEEDRYGSTFSMSGWRLEAFRRNPVILWAHDYGRPPIGRALDVSVTSRGLEFTVEFASRVNAFAREVFDLIKAGFLSGCSVGFLPLKTEAYKSTTVPYGEDVRYVEQELIELSVCPVPANRTTLVNAYAQGRVRESTVIMAGLRGFLNGHDAYSMRVPRVTPRAWEPSPQTVARIEAIMRRRSRWISPRKVNSQ